MTYWPAQSWLFEFRYPTVKEHLAPSSKYIRAAKSITILEAFFSAILSFITEYQRKKQRYTVTYFFRRSRGGPLVVQLSLEASNRS
jgi:hypothetical protein